MIRKSQLELRLSRLEGFGLPKEHLEQYASPATVAAHILHLAAMQGDVEGKTVADFGCGPGIFAIGAALLGAEKVYGVDIDDAALELARKNAELAGVEVEWVKCGVEDFDKKVDTVIQNPPFGVKERHADRPFLQKAVSCAGKVYSLHLYAPENRNFISGFVESLGGKVLAVQTLPFSLPPTLAHHTEARHSVLADLYILEGK